MGITTGLSAAQMPIRTRTVFEQFIAMGEERSLVSLSQSAGVPLSTLKKWSKRYEWFELAKMTDAEITKQLAESQMPQHVARVEKALKAFDHLKEGFYEKVFAGDIKIENISDFLTVLKAENVLIGEAAGRRGDDGDTPAPTTVNQFVNIPPEQMAAVIRGVVAKTHGLPEINVTPK